MGPLFSFLPSHMRLLRESTLPLIVTHKKRREGLSKLIQAYLPHFQTAKETQVGVACEQKFGARELWDWGQGNSNGFSARTDKKYVSLECF